MPTDPRKDVWKREKAKNDKLHVKNEIMLAGGPAGGQYFTIPDGVLILDVEVEGKTYHYTRQPPHGKTFRLDTSTPS